MAPSRVIAAIRVVFLPRLRGTLPWALFPFGALALRRVMEVLKPDSSTNTSLLASKCEASHRHSPLASSSRSWAICDFFDRPSAIRQAGDGPPDGGGGDCLPELFLKSLTVLFEGEIMVCLQLLWQPLSEHHPLPGRPARDRSWLDVPSLPTSL